LYFPVNPVKNAPLHLSRELYKSILFVQNKANFKNDQIYITAYYIRGYGILFRFSRRKNKAKQSQFKPNFGLILALFSPKLALNPKDIFAFANKFNFFADLQSKNAEHSCGRRTFFVNSLLFKAKNPENTNVSDINPCKSVKSAVKYNFINPVILSEISAFSSVSAAKYRLVRNLTGVGVGDRLAGVERENKKPVIGILGGIGSGKSTAAAEFERLGCGLIDADKIAHQLLDEPQIKKKVIEAFGSSILNKDNKIGRKKLADIVFAERSKLTQLNNIIHPAVLQKAEELIEQFNSKPEVKAIVLDMPLLLEIGWKKWCERLIFIDCKAEKRAERSQKTHYFDENQLKIRENLQISLDKKQAIAENTIDNNSELSSLKRQVAEIFSNIVEK